MHALRLTPYVCVCVCLSPRPCAPCAHLQFTDVRDDHSAGMLRKLDAGLVEAVSVCVCVCV
jgi:hypothetical protein